MLCYICYVSVWSLFKVLFDNVRKSLRFTINRIALEVYEVKNKSCENYP